MVSAKLLSEQLREMGLVVSRLSCRPVSGVTLLQNKDLQAHQVLGFAEELEQRADMLTAHAANLRRQVSRKTGSTS